jgi:nucleoside 2-deoxyribosyltransferase
MTQESRPRIYLAGPEVFLDEGIRTPILKSKQAILADLGMVGVDPMESNFRLPKSMSPSDMGISIYRANIQMMKGCQGSIVNLTPFRGVSADAGTLFEVGYLTAMGKPMIGFTMAQGDYDTRFSVGSKGDHEGVDANGTMIEAFGQIDNLMIESAFIVGGGKVIRSKKGMASDVLFDTNVFMEAANSLAGQMMSRGFL